MNYHIIRGIIEIKSGLHIGTNRESLEIGGFENALAKTKKIANGITYEEPFIPGSSLKGKMRALIEMKFGLRNQINRHDPYVGVPTKVEYRRAKGYRDSVIVRLFGSGEEAWRYGPSRLIVRDCNLTDEFAEINRAGKLETEIKTETSILRDVGKSFRVRPIERIPAGVKFNIELILRILDEKDEADKSKYENIIKLAFSLLKIDYLGAGGSRGSGKIVFQNLTLDGKEFSLFDETELSSLNPNDFELEENQVT